MRSNSPDLKELINRYEVSNRAEGKSNRTVKGYNDMLRAFCDYLKATHGGCDLSLITISIAREYILYLQQRPNRNKRNNGLKQEFFLSATTVQDHVRALKHILHGSLLKVILALTGFRTSKSQRPQL